jgi:hypothetical protein
MNMQTLRGMQSAKLKRDLDLKSGNATYFHGTENGEKNKDRMWVEKKVQVDE